MAEVEKDFLVTFIIRDESNPMGLAPGKEFTEKLRGTDPLDAVDVHGGYPWAEYSHGTPWKKSDWKLLPPKDKAQWLLDHQTLSDSTWTEEERLAGEGRSDFIKRVLGYERVANAGACDSCNAAEGGLYHTEDVMPVHENCQCGTEPVFEDAEDDRQFHESVPVDPDLGVPRLDQADPNPIDSAKTLEYIKSRPGIDDLEDTLIKLDDQFETWLESLPTDLIAGWNRQSGTSYKEIYKWLRADRPASKSPLLQEMSKVIDDMVDSMLPSQDDLVVLRGLHGTDLRDALGLKPDDVLDVGTVLTDKAFISTTLDPAVAERYSKGGQRVLMEIKVPKGTKVNWHPDEKFSEITLPPNTKLKITKIDGGIVQAEVVPVDAGDALEAAVKSAVKSPDPLPAADPWPGTAISAAEDAKRQEISDFVAGRKLPLEDAAAAARHAELKSQLDDIWADGWQAKAEWYQRHLRVNGEPHPDPRTSGLGLSKTADQTRDMYVVDDARTLEMNADLRAGGKKTGLVGRVDKMIDESEITEPTDLYRGSVLPKSTVDEFVPGHRYTDLGFQSTAVEETTARNYIGYRVQDGAIGEKVIFRIRAEKGQKAVDLTGEVVLPRGVTTEIVSVTRSADGFVRVDVRIVKEATENTGSAVTVTPVDIPVKPFKAIDDPDGMVTARLLDDEFTPWVDGLDPVARTGFTDYTGYAYKRYNGVLRADPTDLPGAPGVTTDAQKLAHWAADTKDEIQAMVQSSKPLAQDTVVHRGNSLSFRDLFGADPEVGGVISEPAFMSTSASRGQAESFAANEYVDSGTGLVLEIQAPAGTHASYLGSENGFGGEFELLFNPGTKMEILEVRDADHLVVRILP